MRGFVCTIAVVFALTVSASAQPTAWSHNGSLMSVDVADGRISIRYASPRPNMRGAGVVPGTLLFDGQVQQDTGWVFGNARIFSRACRQGIAYAVQGHLVQGAGGRLLTLRGPSPIAASKCSATAFGDDENSVLHFREEFPDGQDPLARGRK